MNLLWVSDFFLKDGVIGGAEKVDNIVIDHLKKEIDVLQIRSQLVTEAHFKHFEKVVVSNFALLRPGMHSHLDNSKYFIMEHDHKYLINRNPSEFRNKKIPKSQFCNIEMYHSAEKVFCQSTPHRDTIYNNIKLNNLIDLKTSIWEDEEYEVLRSKSNNVKNNKCAIVGTNLKSKNYKLAETYCKKNNLSYELVYDNNWSNFIEKMSNYSKLVYFPSAEESFSRIAAEARMLNMDIITNNNIPIINQSWFVKNKGNSLVEYLQNNKANVLETIKKNITGENKHETI